MTRRWTAFVLAAFVVIATMLLAATGIRAAQGRPAPTHLEGGAPVVVIGAAGLDWQDVSPQQTPALWALLRRGTTAAMTVRSVQLNTCPLDG